MKTPACFLKCFTQKMTTVEVVCYKYKPLRNGELPLKIRVTKDRKVRYVSLGVSTKPQHWDFKKNKPKVDCPDRENLERLIATKIQELKIEIVQLKSEGKDYSATSLINSLESQHDKVTVSDLFKQHIQELKNMNRSNYMFSIQQTYNSLLQFKASLDIPFSDIDTQWLKEYELWLRVRGKSINTIGNRLRNLRMIYNLAMERGFVKRDYYPFEKYKVAKLSARTAKRALKKVSISEYQFAQFLGRSRMYGFFPKADQKKLPQMLVTDTQLGLIARSYYQDENFRVPQGEKEINMWKVYNLLTGANKSSYIDLFLDRSLNATELAFGLTRTLHGEGEKLIAYAHEVLNSNPKSLLIGKNGTWSLYNGHYKSNIFSSLINDYSMLKLKFQHLNLLLLVN